uniref:ATP synthase F0 subunit 8 n=1 Tax=Liposcelis nr. bostrychophila AZ TaxID=1643344 RepID=A0A0F6TN96_9NEOP|nr:ATP synthase F0 subunit 8 [Liposcelis nr. bostrychophila AZ]
MPQMAPMLWLMLYFFVSLIILSWFLNYYFNTKILFKPIDLNYNKIIFNFWPI